MWNASARGITNTLSRRAVQVSCGRYCVHGVAAIIRPPVAATRPFSSKYNLSPLDAFRDSVDREARAAQPVGRPWTVQELRLKSYEDLHKLWYVLYMERNMLLTEQQLSRRRTLIFPQPTRMRKVRKSLGAIKQVLGERKRQKISEHNESKLEEGMQSESSDMEDVEVDIESQK